MYHSHSTDTVPIMTNTMNRHLYRHGRVAARKGGGGRVLGRSLPLGVRQNSAVTFEVPSVELI